MEFNIEKLAQIASSRSEIAIEKAKARKENREWLRMSQEIALSLHHYLRTKGMTQSELAVRMGVSAVYVGKLLKGCENLTLETICKIQSATGQIFVSVEKPFRSKCVLTLSPTRSFSPNAAESEKYTGIQSIKGEYIMATYNVA